MNDQDIVRVRAGRDFEYITQFDAVIDLHRAMVHDNKGCGVDHYQFLNKLQLQQEVC